ncbi:permease prefix domain 1-containing protein [Alkalibacillus haloalkaliphilus]|uniref:Uncharacterized protein n=1 Tax=Alkalibacillus haloalkaliphilus TaxID=94136 RepID=A0A511W7K8_9BACI|nr:permease prefix domain 1-containing protein [Alkalibacillus haloalkaliphilus]GEN46043.1 hypothetical protein AHA02nite_18190 [Alkalibacillus haloalkaliphilus]
MNLNQEVKKYVDDLFNGVGESQQLFDLKQELVTNMHERIQDYKSKGMTDEEALKEAQASLGDLGGLVEDMREHGKDQVRQEVYSSMTNRISIGSLVIGTVLILFGLLMSVSMFFMEVEAVAIPGTGIFAVVGGAILTYGLLAKETEKYYAMSSVRAVLYASAIGTILFAIFVALTSGLATGEMFVAITSFTVFFVIGFGLLLALFLTTKVRRRKD